MNQIFREPYCAGLPAGLATNWSVGVEYVVSQLASRPHVAGVFLGDEPEIGGVPGEQMCELSLTLKRRLQQAGRGDVFLYYNDGPGSIQLKRPGGLCAGLRGSAGSGFSRATPAPAAAARAHTCTCGNLRRLRIAIARMH